MKNNSFKNQCYLSGRLNIKLCLVFGCLCAIVLSSLYINSSCFKEETKTRDIPFQNSLDRQEWWSQVTGLGPSIQQTQKANKAIEIQLKRHQTAIYRDAGINGWNELGPTNIGGRIRAVAINPDDTQEIFIGAAAGGIWRSSNGGSNWSLVTPDLVSFPVTSIAIHPNNPDIIVAGTGELIGSSSGGNQEPSGIGIIKSIDGGDSWYITTSPAPQLPPAPHGYFMLWISKIIFNFENPSVLFAVGSSASENQGGARGRIYKSTNGGENWTTLWTESASGFSTHITDIEINPIDTTELVIGTLNQAYISNDAGISWTSFMGSGSPAITTLSNYSGGRCEVEYCSSNPANIVILRYAIANGGSNWRRSEVWHTSTGGNTWSILHVTQADSSVPGDEDINILSRQGHYDNVLWVDPTDCSRMLLGGINLWKYQNSALTRISEWQDDIGGNSTFLAGNNSLHADQHMIYPDPNYNGTGNRRVFIGNDGGLYKSEFIWQAETNSGWTSLVNGLNITQLYGVDVSKTGDTLVGGSQDNSYFTERSGNSSDNVWQVHGTGDGGHGAIKKSDPEIIYTSTQRGNFIKSTNGGDTYWDMFNLGPVGENDQPVFIAPFEMDPNNDDILYAGGQRLWQGTDEGDDWETIKSDIVAGRSLSTIEIAKGNGNLIWIGYNTGQVANTLNGGANWNPILASSSGAYVNDIAINPNNHNEVMIVRAGGYHDNGISFSDDGGATWLDRPVALGQDTISAQTFSVTWHPKLSDWIYIGTDRGIFASEDKGLNWSVTPLYTEGEGPIYTPIVELVWQGTGSAAHPYYLVAASHGRGVWRTKAPIRNKYYVDKNCDPCGTGSFSRPYATFRNAVDAAGHGTEIIILTGSEYNEVPSSILLQRRIKVTLANSASSSFIIK